VPTIVTLITGVVTYQALTQSLETADRVRHTQDVIADGNELLLAVVNAQGGGRGFVITGDETYLTSFTEGNASFEEQASQLRALVSDNPSQVARVDQMVELHQQWLDQATLQIDARRTGGLEEAVRLVSSGVGKGLVDDLRSVVADFIRTEQSLLRTRTDASDSAASSSRSFVLFGLGLVILLGLAIGFGLSSRLSKSAEAVTTAADGLAAGDTTIRAEVRSSDEIGWLAKAFNSMADRLVAAAESERATREGLQSAVLDYSAFAARVADGDLTARVGTNGSQDLQTLSENLNSMVLGLSDITTRVREDVQGIGSATSEILASVSQHTASASQQSAAINETSTTVDEARAASEQTALRAKQVAEQANLSVEVSDDGIGAVENIARTMEEIRDRVEAIASDILTLSEQSQQIGQITATVNDLADQSNILALNASIEAAKAGEHGKGFAVVATEVRNLAEQSKGATEQVRGILTDIQKATTAAVLATEQGTKVVEQGLELSQKAGDGIRSLADTIREAAEAAQQIAASAHEQSVGMDQIAQAMSDVNEGTTQFVAGAQQSQKAAEDLNELSGRLSSLTDRYRVSESGR
jgi:methyl-accepting chemotaxis protein